MPKKVKLIESGMYFRKLPFTRFVKQVIQELEELDVHVASTAMESIQAITEDHVSNLMHHSKLAIAHAGRETLRKDDIDLVIQMTTPTIKGEEEQRPSRVRVRKDATTKTKKQTLYDNEDVTAISMPGIQRAAVKVGIERIGEDVYPHCVDVIADFMHVFLKDAIVSAKYNKRYTIKDDDVEDAVKRGLTRSIL